MSGTAATKDPAAVERGRKAMRVRWGPPRVLRLDKLDPVTREVVTTIVEARRNAAEAAEARRRLAAAQDALAAVASRAE